MSSTGRRSIEMERDSPSVMTEKYNCLLQAYKKQKTENNVLKKSLLGEQEKVTTAETLIKEKEVALRVSVEENDMLTFNNQRLTKRVEQLMVQLQEEKVQSGQGWGGFFSGSKTEIIRLNEELEVCKEQLQRKLEENETLVSQMFQMRSEHEQTVAMLDKKLHEWKKDSKEKEDDMSHNSKQHDAMVVDLNEEKNAINIKVTILEKELENTRGQMIEREQTMTTINRQLSTDLERTQQLFDHKVAFDDTRVSEFNNLNCPGFDRIQMVRKIEIAEGFMSLLDTFTTTYAVHDASMKDRLTLMGRNFTSMSKLQNMNEKIIELIPEHAVHLGALQTSCQEGLLAMKATLDIKLRQQLVGEGQLTNLQTAHVRVSQLFTKLVRYHNKVLPYELLSLMEEARKDTCVPVLQARNYVLISTQKRFIAALEKLAVYVQLALSSDIHTRSQEANAPTILKHATNSMASVHQAFQAYASHLISKISQEHRAAFVLPELKAVNEKVLNSLSILTATTGKMVELMNDYISSQTTAGETCTVRGVECDPLKMSEDLQRMQTRARHFYSRILQASSAKKKLQAESAQQQQDAPSTSAKPDTPQAAGMLSSTSPDHSSTQASHSFAEDPLFTS